MKTPGTIETVNGIKVVTLTPEEEKEYERLAAEKRAFEMSLYTHQKAATAAVKQRNAAARRVKEATAKWLVLAEKKYPEDIRRR